MHPAAHWLLLPVFFLLFVPALCGKVVYIFLLKEYRQTIFSAKAFYFFNCYISCYNKNGINRAIMFKEKILLHPASCAFSICDKFFPDGHPAVGMFFIGQFPHFMPCIAIRFIDIMFFKFFTYHFALYIQAFFIKGK